MSSCADVPHAVPEPAGVDIAASATGRAAFSAPPCFYWKWCSQRAVVNKVGRSVCRGCASTLRGREFPLRDPSEDRREMLRHQALLASAKFAPPL